MSNDSEPSPKFITVDKWKGKNRRLPKLGRLPSVQHHFDEKSLHAINTALASGRPLLVRGEPGTGKSQLARAAATLLGREYAWRVLDAQTRISDLFYDFDAVERLAQAQIAGAVCQHDDPAERRREVKAWLDERKFIRPGPLWKAFDPAMAEAWPQEPEIAERDEPRRPYVVLLDEIDKTDPSVPNGLLEALGHGTFPVLGDTTTVALDTAKRPPLVVVTTNDERELPGAFVRRCIVHHIRLPEPGAGLEAWLVQRGETHFSDLSDAIRERAAELVCKDRQEARKLGLLPPGQAEYLDLLRAVRGLVSDEDERKQMLETIADFALKKHPDLLDQEMAVKG